MKLLFSILLFLLSFSANADTARVDSVLIIKADSIKLAQKTTKRLKIIPTHPSQTLDKAKIQAYLDKVYDQAVMHWDVEIISQYKPTITLGDNGLDIGEDENRKDLTEEMKALRDDFKKQGLVQKDDAQTYYVFLVDKFSDASIDGYFPQSKLYGFVKYSTSEPTLHKTLAHELGHGAYYFEHFWDEVKGAQKGATSNIMDYTSNPTDLRVFQWDDIHERPADFISPCWKSDEAGQSVACETELSFFQNLVNEGSSVNYLQLLRAENSIKELKLGKSYGRDNLVVYEINVNDNLKINYFKNYWQNSVSKLFRIDEKIDKTNSKYAFIYYDPNTPIRNDSKLDAHIAVWEPEKIIRKDTPYCYRKIELPYGTTAGGALVDEYPNLVFKGFQIGAGVYFFGNLLAGEGLVLASENAALFSKNCLVAMSLDLGFQIAVTKLIKQMNNSSDPSVKLSDISYASLLASCGTGNIKECDAKCMASIGGLTGFADNFIKQTIFEKKDLKDLDIGQMIDNATIQAVGAAIISKSISYFSNKITKENWAKLVVWLKKGGKVTQAGNIYKDFSKPISFGGDIIKRTGKKLNILGRAFPTDGSINTKDIYNELKSFGVPDNEITGLFVQMPKEWRNTMTIIEQNIKYWKELNKPHIDDIIANGGDIRFIHDPRLPENQWNWVKDMNQKNEFVKKAKAEGITKVKSFMYQEYEYLVSKGYVLDANTGLMIKP